MTEETGAPGFRRREPTEVSAGYARSKSLDLGRVQERGKVREGCYWGPGPLEKAGSYDEQVDRVNSSQSSAGGDWVEQQGTWWVGWDAQREPGVVDSVLVVAPEAAGALLEARGSASHWGEQEVAPEAGRAFLRAAEACWL